MANFKCVLYTSSWNSEMSAADLEKLYSLTAYAYRKEHRITGVSIFVDRNVMQYLEGDSIDVDLIYNKAVVCNQSGYIEIINELISERNFPDWTMAVDAPNITGELEQSSNRWKNMLSMPNISFSNKTCFRVLKKFWEITSRN